jgi:hypothetical protein
VYDLLKRDLAFEVISNFQFDGSVKFLPREVFNGK